MRAAKRPEVERALDRPTLRCFLLYGPDQASSRALADRLAKAIGGDAERVDLDGATLAKDPARLADEAASISLFGGARYILVRGGDEATEAVEALLDAPQAGNPVAIVAGALKPASRLLKLVTGSSDAMAFASYMPDARDAVPLVTGLAQPLGLRLTPDVARRIFEAAAGDRAVIGRELEKLALYVDASPENPGVAEQDALDAIGAGEGESSSAVLVDAVLTGAARDAVEELKQLAQAGEEGVPLIRRTLARLLQLASLRAEADASSVEAALAKAGKSIFWKEQKTIEAELRRWSAPELARLIGRLTAVQAKLLAPATAGPVLVADELLMIARVAGRSR